jgi:hypothetical protein
MSKFDEQLQIRGIPGALHGAYQKWLRYYLDFCQKYHFPPKQEKSLPPFMQKLQEKRQSKVQQEKAQPELAGRIDPESFPSGRGTGASWKSEYTRLADEISIRHYSLKTLKTYRGWVQKFQTFTQSKTPALLSTDNVKEFLTSLAVKSKVSSTTQNQAFNSLLFFYRHVLGKECRGFSQPCN